MVRQISDPQETPKVEAATGWGRPQEQGSQIRVLHWLLFAFQVGGASAVVKANGARLVPMRARHGGEGAPCTERPCPTPPPGACAQPINPGATPQLRLALDTRSEAKREANKSLGTSGGPTALGPSRGAAGTTTLRASPPTPCATPLPPWTAQPTPTGGSMGGSADARAAPPATMGGSADARRVGFADPMGGPADPVGGSADIGMQSMLTLKTPPPTHL